MFCKKCGINNDEGSKFCKGCGTTLLATEGDNTQEVAQEATQEVTKEVTQEVKKEVTQEVKKSEPINKDALVSKGKGFIESLKTNKKNRLIAIGVLALVVVLGVFLGYSSYTKNNVSKSTIKKDFIGKTVSFGSMRVELTEDNLKSVSIDEKTSLEEMGIKTYNGKGTILIETDNYKAKAPISISYIYNTNSILGEKGWMLVSNNVISSGDGVELEIKEKVSEDSFRKALVGEKLSGIEITEEIAKGLKFEKLEEKNFGTVAEATLLLEHSGKFVSKKMNITAMAKFTGEEWKFEKSASGKVETSIKVTTEEISTDDFKKDLNLLMGEKALRTNFGYTSFNVPTSDITEVKELKVDSITTGSEKEYVITGKLKAKSNKVSIEGLLDIKVTEKGYGSFEIKDSVIAVEAPTKEEIVEIVGGKNIEYFKDTNRKSHKITDGEKKSLKVEEVIPFKGLATGFFAFGKISYSDVTEDLVTISIKYDLNTKKFYVESITSSTDPSYVERHSKEALLKSMEKDLGV